MASLQGNDEILDNWGGYGGNRAWHTFAWVINDMVKFNQKAKKLRKKYPRFFYKSYSYRISNNNLEMSFNFHIEPGISFSPKVIIKGINGRRINAIGEKVMNNFVFHLGMIEIPSYWKAVCSPEIIIEAGSLDVFQQNWWRNLILNGMGQFFFENKINFRNSNFLSIKAKGKSSGLLYTRKLNNKGFLAAVGGGKDSAVTLEILKKTKKNLSCFSLNPSASSLGMMKAAGCSRQISISRIIDKNLLLLNKKGYLNGHTPFSAYLAFLSVLLGVLFDRKYAVFSNEHSANEGNVEYLGRIMNHQWSKTFEFEQMFRQYSKKYLAKDMEYFSLLRPLYEIQIAKIFANYPKYFLLFISCNKAQKTNSGRYKPSGKWCGACPKCLFVYLILYPFIDRNILKGIFKQDILNKKELLPVFLELTGERGFKPFECVGTKKEILSALYLSLEKNRDLNLPFLLNYFKKNILPKYPNLKNESKKLMISWNKENNLTSIVKDDILRMLK
ncbi:MAG: hypothetical protein Q7T34_01240 [Candidatus Parcubacteria bacterium]|nr:hypothetical protein [Candidatus Parcubacteria bacterium]